MHDALIEDISCDGVNVPMYIWHRKFESIPTNLRFETAEELDTYALRLCLSLWKPCFNSPANA